MKKICDIEGYENIKPYYYVNKDGVIMSFSDRQGGARNKKEIRKQSKKKCGYYYVGLMRNDGKLTHARVHRIVAKAFVKNENGLELVHHKDGNKTNNKAENLEWIDNKTHSRITNSKPLYCYHRDGTLDKKYEYAVLVKEDGYSHSHACNVARGIEKTHKNRYFSFVPLSTEDVLQRLSKSYPEAGRRK